MKDGHVAQATIAASSLARTLGLAVDEALAVQNSNALGLRLLPCDTFARIAVAGHENAAREVAVAKDLVAAGAPVATPDPRVDPQAYRRDGFAITFWSFYRTQATPITPPDFASALVRLHTTMRDIDHQWPHFTERIAEAEHLLTQRGETPALADDDRRLLLDTLRTARNEVLRRTTLDQLLHGEPHRANVLSTRGGPLFIDFETCCVGPIEFDVAHVPDEVSGHYPGVDHVLLQECRRLVLVMVAAWRFDRSDEFPDGRRYADQILRLLREGPPWPTLDQVFPNGELPGDAP